MKNTPLKESEFEQRLRKKAAQEAESDRESSSVDVNAPDTTSEPTEADDEITREAELPEDLQSAHEKEIEALKDQLLRARAEFDNYRKRVARDHERIRATAAETLIRALMPVVDSLERALDHRESDPANLSEGLEMVHKQLYDALEQQGLRSIHALGEVFDPQFHEAVTQVDSDEVQAGIVAQEFQKGYILGDSILRPSGVAVSRGPAEGPETNE